MKIAVVCNDTRGGVQPYVALAIGLSNAGHDVRAVAPEGLASIFHKYGLSAAALSGSPEAMMRAYGFAGMNALQRLDLMLRKMPTLAGQTALEVLEACEGVELLTGGIGGMVTGIPVADKLSVPFVPTHLQPIGMPSDTYPGVSLAGRVPKALGGIGNRLSHAISDKVISMQFSGALRQVRGKALGLNGPSAATLGQPTLYGFSKLVVPAVESSDRIVTGYWSLPADEKWSAPASLQEFLNGDEPVVSVGFGSMVGNSADRLTDTVIAAVHKAKVRAVILEGWGGLKTGETDATIHVMKSVPHEWLFPKVQCIVHHGGAGTTAAALTAGIPNFVVPFAADQPFWGSRVESLGVGPSPVPIRKLSVGRLANAIRLMITDGSMKERAESLGRALRTENGVARAVESFDRIAAKIHKRSF